MTRNPSQIYKFFMIKMATTYWISSAGGLGMDLFGLQLPHLIVMHGGEHHPGLIRQPFDGLFKQPATDECHRLIYNKEATAKAKWLLSSMRYESETL